MVCSGHFWFFLVIINLTRPPPSQFCQHCCFTTIAINRHAPWMPGGHHQETSQASTSCHRTTDQSWLDAQGHPTPHLPKKKNRHQEQTGCQKCLFCLGNLISMKAVGANKSCALWGLSSSGTKTQFSWKQSQNIFQVLQLDFAHPKPPLTHKQCSTSKIPC